MVNSFWTVTLASQAIIAVRNIAEGGVAGVVGEGGTGKGVAIRQWDGLRGSAGAHRTGIGERERELIMQPGNTRKLKLGTESEDEG